MANRPIPIFVSTSLYAGAATSSPISRVSPTFGGTVALPSNTDVLIVGAGPASSAAAIHAARTDFPVAVVDSQRFPRGKTRDDGLTPRAIARLRHLGLDDGLLRRNRNRELRLHDFGDSIAVPWPDDVSDAFPAVGSAVSRVEFDTFLLNATASAGAQVFDGIAAREVVLKTLSSGGTRGHGVREVELSDRGDRPHTISARWLLVADGIRSTAGKQLERTWHRDSVFGVAARPYVSFDSMDVADDRIRPHLELHDSEGRTHPGYSWILLLGAGQANVECGTLTTSACPAYTNVKKLLCGYHGQVREQWQMSEPGHMTSALLPVGDAVSDMAGPNWALFGDAACLANPLNSEGIDYGMESARPVVELISSTGAGRDGLTHSWPALLREHYGTSFSLARKLALALTYSGFLPTVGPLAIGAPWGSQLMGIAVRLMGNLVTEHDRDMVAWLQRASGQMVLTSDKWFRRQP